MLTLYLQYYYRKNFENFLMNCFFFRYGYFVSDNSYFICYSPQTIDKIFNKVRFGENPVSLIT